MFFLIRGNKPKEKVGTLEIGRNASSGKIDGRYFEWRGSNGTSDGGIWQWNNHAIYGGDFTMQLTSNETKALIVALNNLDWGLVEPNELLFKNGAKGSLAYVPPISRSFSAF
jgi:hypothetical protein